MLSQCGARATHQKAYCMRRGAHAKPDHSDGHVGSLGREELFACFAGEFFIQHGAVVDIMVDEPFGQVKAAHEAEKLFMSVGAKRLLSIDQDHDFYSFACLDAADALATGLRFGEHSIHETVVELEADFNLQPSALLSATDVQKLPP
jgi:hypothetical protein